MSETASSSNCRAAVLRPVTGTYAPNEVDTVMQADFSGADPAHTGFKAKVERPPEQPGSVYARCPHQRKYKSAPFQASSDIVETGASATASWNATTCSRRLTEALQCARQLEAASSYSFSRQTTGDSSADSNLGQDGVSFDDTTQKTSSASQDRQDQAFVSDKIHSMRSMPVREKSTPFAVEPGASSKSTEYPVSGKDVGCRLGSEDLLGMDVDSIAGSEVFKAVHERESFGKVLCADDVWGDLRGDLPEVCLLNDVSMTAQAYAAQGDSPTQKGYPKRPRQGPNLDCLPLAPSLQQSK